MIIGIIASVTAKVLIAGLDVYSMVVNSNDSFHSARVAMERMEDEIILLRSVSSFGPASFSFRDAASNTVSFSLNPHERHGRPIVDCIMRGSDYLAGEATQLNFTYYKADGTTTIRNANTVRRINIDFTIQQSPDTGMIRLKSEVFPRSFMYTNFQ